MDFSFLSGPLGGGLIALVVFLLTRQHQLHQDSLKDARTLRDARRERLRGLYETTLVALSVWTNPSTGDRSEARKQLDHAQLSLVLERESRVLAALRTALTAHAELEAARAREFNPARGLPATDAEPIKPYHQDFLARIDDLHKRMQTSLLLLEQPIRKVGQQFAIYVPETLDALPEIVEANKPRWPPTRPKREIRWEKP